MTTAEHKIIFITWFFSVHTPVYAFQRVSHMSQPMLYWTSVINRYSWWFCCIENKVSYVIKEENLHLSVQGAQTITYSILVWRAQTITGYNIIKTGFKIVYLISVSTYIYFTLLPVYHPMYHNIFSKLVYLYLRGQEFHQGQQKISCPKNNKADYVVETKQNIKTYITINSRLLWRLLYNTPEHAIITNESNYSIIVLFC